jgi:hypothetical protein
LRHWYFHSARQAVFAVVTALLVLIGFLIIVQYSRFRGSPLAYRVCVLAVLVSVRSRMGNGSRIFGGEQIVVPSWHGIREYGRVFLAVMLLPAAHFILSAVGLYASARQAPNQAMQRTTGRPAF